jgi:2-polyprenyl-3-methyl-5-hydroxy-6-metoxy-1,4-benzoquinol methylase
VERRTPENCDASKCAGFALDLVESKLCVDHDRITPATAILSVRDLLRDKSNGYEAIAESFTRARTLSIGPKIVRQWAKRLRPGASILDIGCGNGIPISKALLDEGFTVYGIDASKTLVADFEKRFPDVPVECGSVEESVFFNRTFDAGIAWGLMFLLPADTQVRLIGKVAHALHRHGHFLFTSPRDACSWMDAMTRLPSISLGHDVYVQELVAHGLALVGNDEDEGENYYYFARKL